MPKTDTDTLNDIIERQQATNRVLSARCEVLRDMVLSNETLSAGPWTPEQAEALGWS